MFKIISIMFVGLGAGYLLRDLKLMRKTEKTIPLTVFAMIVCLFFLLGCLIGFGVHIQLDTHNLSMYILIDVSGGYQYR